MGSTLNPQIDQEQLRRISRAHDPEEWITFVQSYVGRPEDFEAWAWKALNIPEEMLYIAPYEPPPPQADIYFLCTYHGCSKVYKNKQAREKHLRFRAGALSNANNCSVICLETSSPRSQDFYQAVAKWVRFIMSTIDRQICYPV
ncbi:hypothetical protein BT96DRAFT_975367 [Gymnopus androsaceus JB14]|uniref:C2H2-type domain-containing protein n=1 Tax=Gymnopus androsaceus JB14 TaxID=1447944 RepID=A0A6A4HPE4_9AGAR|nr:hypothetical protein BT96DRAFT_975367 [Gymnopus androsaceus JB14]